MKMGERQSSRFAHGRLSEVLGSEGPGSAGANTLIDDRFARIFNWKYWGEQDAELIGKQFPVTGRRTVERRTTFAAMVRAQLRKLLPPSAEKLPAYR